MLRSNVRFTAQEFADLRNQVKAVRESGVHRTMFVSPPRQLYTCTWANGFYMLHDTLGNQVMQSSMPMDVIGYLRTRPGISSLGFDDGVRAMSVSASKSKSKSMTPTPPSLQPLPIAVARTSKSVRTTRTSKRVQTARTSRTVQTARTAQTPQNIAKTHRRKGVPQQAPVN